LSAPLAHGGGVEPVVVVPAVFGVAVVVVPTVVVTVVVTVTVGVEVVAWVVVPWVVVPWVVVPAVVVPAVVVPLVVVVAVVVGVVSFPDVLPARAVAAKTPSTALEPSARIARVRFTPAFLSWSTAASSDSGSTAGACPGVAGTRGRGKDLRRPNN
jgi:hypothetical protein